MKHIAEILEDLFAELEFREQKNYGRVYFYPVNDGAKALMNLMKRETLTVEDVPKLKDLGKHMGLEIRIKIQQQRTEL